MKQQGVVMDIPTLTPEEIAGSLQTALERMLAPVVDSIGQIERLKRREYLTAEEVELIYGLKAVTLANKRKGRSISRTATRSSTSSRL